MNDKKAMAKKMMLEKLSKELRDGSHKPIAEGLKGKKLSKVEVIAKDEKGLEKGLSKAQQLLKAKFGDAGLSEDEMEDVDSEEYSEEEEEEIDESCPICDGEGCKACEE